MKILAIDPGNTQSAYAVMDSTTFEISDYGIHTNDPMRQKIIDLTADYPTIEHVVVEMIQSFGMAVGKEVFETVFWIGRFCEASNVDFSRVYRGDVKLHLCRSARAKDKNIRQALLDRLGPQGTKKSPGPTYGISKDVWSAVAVGLTWIDTQMKREAS